MRSSGRGVGRWSGRGLVVWMWSTTTWGIWPTAVIRRARCAPTRSTCLRSGRWLARRGARGRARSPRRCCCGSWRFAGRRPLRVGRAATCTRSATAATSATRRRRSTAGSPRSPGCSPGARCGTGSAVDPVPHGGPARRATAGERSGLLAHLRKPKQRSRLRVREPRRLPRGLDRTEATALVSSLRTDRDRAIAGLMLLSGLRSAEVLGLRVLDVDIGRGWVRVIGKGDKERRVPLDPDVAGLIQTYLFAERPETDCDTLFRGGEGPEPGQAADRGRAAHDLPLPPAEGRGAGRASARAAALPSAPRWPRPGWTWRCCRR